MIGFFKSLGRESAIAGDVDYLVSNDKYLKIIDFPKLILWSIDEFMDLLIK